MACLSASSVFLCPSIYEPLGIVNLEAMAAELPVVASKVGGIPEVVIDQKTGYLVDYNPDDTKQFVYDFSQAILKIFDNPLVSQKMASAGFRRAKKQFSWDKIAQQTIDFYRICLL
jgi:starch synthase